VSYIVTVFVSWELTFPHKNRRRWRPHDVLDHGISNDLELLHDGRVSGKLRERHFQVHIVGHPDIFLRVQSIVELCGANPKAWPPGKKMGDAISPPGGYVGGGMQMLIDIAVDPAGNVWVDNNWQNIDAALDRAPEPLSTLGAGQGVVVFYGLATPVRTPLIGPVQQP
jgi:hypothetical protein